jgi:rod shape-determining protein MreC
MASSRDDFGIAIRSALLKKGNRQKFSLFFLFCFGFIIFFLDYYKSNFILKSRSTANDIVYRVSNLATFPFNWISSANEVFNEHFSIQEENKKLKKELLLLKKKELDNKFLISQNNDYQKILSSNTDLSTQPLEDKNQFVTSRVILDKDSPYLKSIIINRGIKSKIKKGMPVLSNGNLIGRIVETNQFSSRVLLLNDLNSRIPVVISNTSAQAILTGTGDTKPHLEYLPENYISENQLSVFTSGKDGIFAAGIPIGETIIKDNILMLNLYSDPNQLSYVSVQIVTMRNKDF